MVWQQSTGQTAKSAPKQCGFWKHHGFFNIHVVGFKQRGERCGKEKFRVTMATADIKQDVINSAARRIIWFSVQGFQKMFLQYREMDLLIAHENCCLAKSVATAMFEEEPVAEI